MTLTAYGSAHKRRWPPRHVPRKRRWPTRADDLSITLEPPGAYLPNAADWIDHPRDVISRLADVGAGNLYADTASVNDPVRATGLAFDRMVVVAERAREILAGITPERFASAIESLERDAGPNSYAIYLAIDLYESVGADPSLVLGQADLWLGMVRQCRYEYCISGGRSV